MRHRFVSAAAGRLDQAIAAQTPLQDWIVESALTGNREPALRAVIEDPASPADEGACRALFDELARLQVFYVNIGGGEPMVRKDFFDIVRKDHDVAVKLLWSFLGVLTERLRSTSRDLGAAREQLQMMSGGDLLSEEDLVEDA